MARRKTPVIGQAMLPMPGIESMELEPLAQANQAVAFERVLMPYFLGLKPENYTDITPNMVRAVRFSNFMKYLLPAEGRGKFAVQGVALNKGEYQRLARWPNAIERNTRNNAERSRILDSNPERIVSRADKAVRADFDKRIPAMQRTVQGIQNEQTVVLGLAKEAHTAGYAHVDFLTMRSWADQARYGVFQNILDVVGREKEWTNDQADLASRALDVSLYFDTENRADAYRNALSVSVRYAREREKLFTSRIDQAGRIVGNIALEHSETVL